MKEKNERKVKKKGRGMDVGVVVMMMMIGDKREGEMFCLMQMGEI